MLAAIRAGRRVEHFETVRKARDGRLLPISLTVSPILDANGTVIGASKIARDISDRKNLEQQAAKASQREAFLAEATVTLTSSVDYEQTLRTLCRLAVPYLADYCAFDVINVDGVLTRVAAVHALPEKASLAEDLRTRYDGSGCADQSARGDTDEGAGRHPRYHGRDDGRECTWRRGTSRADSRVWRELVLVCADCVWCSCARSVDPREHRVWQAFLG